MSKVSRAQMKTKIYEILREINFRNQNERGELISLHLKNHFHEIFCQIRNETAVWKSRNFTLPETQTFLTVWHKISWKKSYYRKFWFHEIFIWMVQERVSRFPFPTLWFGTESFFWSISYLQKVYKITNRRHIFSKSMANHIFTFIFFFF